MGLLDEYLYQEIAKQKEQMLQYPSATMDQAQFEQALAARRSGIPQYQNPAMLNQMNPQIGQPNQMSEEQRKQLLQLLYGR